MERFNTPNTVTPGNSTSGEAPADFRHLFEEANADLSAACNIVEFGMTSGDVGVDKSDAGVTLVFPMRILLNTAIEKFDEFDIASRRPISQAEQSESIDALFQDAVFVLLAALSLAEFADLHDADGAGRLLFPVFRLLRASNQKFSQIEVLLFQNGASEVGA